MENKEDLLLELQNRLEKIKKFFNLNKILATPIDKRYIENYYRINRFAYGVFFKNKPFMHMGLSENGVYTGEDLLGWAKIVEKYINLNKVNNVLELSFGRGGNSIYLAKKFPNINFFGLDLSKDHFKRATSLKNKEKINNFFPEKGDYHDLSRFKEDNFEIVFVVESLCYSLDKQKVLKEVKRILKNDGVFIVVDGYINADEKKLSDNEKIAVKLTAIGMAVLKPECYVDFLKIAQQEDFEIKDDDFSLNALPTMVRLEKFVKIFFNFPFYPWFGFLIKLFSSNKFRFNAISAYLMPLLIKLNITSYKLTFLEK